MSRIVPFANPAYALAGVRTPDSTAMPTARTEAVRIGNAPTMTETIVAAKIANSCQAGGVSPSGTGQNQIAAPRANTPRRASRDFAPGVTGHFRREPRRRPGFALRGRRWLR